MFCKYKKSNCYQVTKNPHTAENNEFYRRPLPLPLPLPPLGLVWG
jgi:hypothetical protein